MFVASIIRVTSFNDFRIDDGPYTGDPTALWTEAEQSLRIICACLPCLRPLFAHSRSGGPKGTADKLVPGCNIYLTALSSKRSTMARISGDGSRKAAGFARLPEEKIAKSRSTAKATSASHLEPGLRTTEDLGTSFDRRTCDLAEFMT